MKKIIILFLLLTSSVGIFSQATYLWTGSINSNFSTAGNWNPFRQYMYATDILIIENGGNVNITSVNQITVGQLIIRNHTSVTMTPNAGNPRVISIQGNHSSLNKGNQSNYNIGDLKYSEYSISEDMGQLVDLPTIKFKEYKSSDSTIDLPSLRYDENKIPDIKGMGDIKNSDREIDKISEINGMGDIKYSDQELDNLIDGDLLIDTSSSLTITSNNPRLSLYIKEKAKASIFGSLIFEGSKDPNINSVDSNAVVFKAGSTLVQSCPGFIFSNTGTKNSVVFEDNSSLIINNAAASPPFGLTAPDSKVKFERGSNLIISVSHGNLQFDGRILPNIKIQNNSNVIINDSPLGFSVDSLNVSAPGSLKLVSGNISATPVININGNLNVNGSLFFIDSLSSEKIKFSGNSLQNIMGNGNISFPAHGNVIIKNDIRLFRDLTIPCSFSRISGNIDYNGFTITVNGRGYSQDTTGSGNKPHQVNNTSIPAQFSLSQNYPNPFNPITKIDFAIPITSIVTISVFDIMGKEITSIINGSKEPNYYTIEFDGSNMASGIYFYRIVTNRTGEKYTETKKMILAK